MNRMLLLVALSGILACSKKPASTESFPEHQTAVPAPEANVEQGWVSLFDGATLEGWKTYQNRPNNTWEVKEGILHCKPVEQDHADQRADLVTIASYDNFEFTFDFKSAAETNSGVMFRVLESLEQPYFSGPEYQILDDGGFKNKPDNQLTGSCFGLYAAGLRNLKPAGQWNTGRIVANGTHIEHWLNGDKILSYDINSPDWLSHRDQSNWKKFPEFGQQTSGLLVLQDHGTEVWFRNLMLRKL